jgi:hypothetical protein
MSDLPHPTPPPPKRVPMNITLSSELQGIAKALVEKVDTSMVHTKRTVAKAIAEHRRIVQETADSTRAMWDTIFNLHPELKEHGDNLVIDRDTWEIVLEQKEEGCGDGTCQHCGNPKHENYDDAAEEESMEIPDPTPPVDPTAFQGEKNSKPVGLDKMEKSTSPDGSDLYVQPQTPVKPSTPMPTPPPIENLTQGTAREMVKDFLSSIGHKVSETPKEETPPEGDPAKD